MIPKTCERPISEILNSYNSLSDESPSLLTLSLNYSWYTYSLDLEIPGPLIPLFFSYQPLTTFASFPPQLRNHAEWLPHLSDRYPKLPCQTVIHSTHLAKAQFCIKNWPFSSHLSKDGEAVLEKKTRLLPVHLGSLTSNGQALSITQRAFPVFSGRRPSYCL